MEAATEERFYEYMQNREELKEAVCNCLKRLGFRLLAPKRSMTVTGTLNDEYRGLTVHRFEYVLSARIRSVDNGGVVFLMMSEQSRKFGQQWSAKKLAEVVDALDQEVLDYLEARDNIPEPDTFGSARFSTAEELEGAGYVVAQPEDSRLLLAPWGDRYLSVPVEQTSWHALVCGPTGAGKSSGFFLPNLITRVGSSCIVTEATAGYEAPELYAKTAGWRHFQDNEIYYFNPDHIDSTRINPMDVVIMAPPEETAAAADSLANVVIVNTSPPTVQRVDPIWDKAEKWLLWIMIMDAVSSGDPERCHFGAIRDLLRNSDKEIIKTLQKSPNPQVHSEFAAFLNHTSENFRHGVFSGLLGRLNPWLTPKIVTLTRKSDLDIDELKDQLFTFYLSVPSRKPHLKPVAALIFNYLIDLALDKQFKYPLALMLDEFTNFGAIPGIDEALSIIRRRHLPVVLGCQSFKQITRLYGQDASDIIVEQLATRVYFRPRSKQTAKNISDELGQKTILKREISEAGQVSEREFGLPLLSVSDLMTMQPEEVLVMLPSQRPIMVQRFNYANFPPPQGYEPPARHAHSQVKQTHSVVVEEKPKSTKEKVSKTEREFFKEVSVPTPPKPAEEEANEKDDEIETDWNIPG